jgi:hypothetical protein
VWTALWRMRANYAGSPATTPALEKTLMTEAPRASAPRSSSTQRRPLRRQGYHATGSRSWPRAPRGCTSLPGRQGRARVPRSSSRLEWRARIDAATPARRSRRGDRRHVIVLADVSSSGGSTAARSRRSRRATSGRPRAVERPSRWLDTSRRARRGRRGGGAGAPARRSRCPRSRRCSCGYGAGRRSRGGAALRRRAAPKLQPAPAGRRVPRGERDGSHGAGATAVDP